LALVRNARHDGSRGERFRAQRAERRICHAQGLEQFLPRDVTQLAFSSVGKHFFQSGSDTAALLATFAVFGVGFAARPIGGVLIGLFGDRFGRKPALLPTFGQKYAGLTPGAALWSTVLATMVMGITALLSGALSDVVGRRACLLASCALSLVLAYPFIGAMIGASTATVIALHLCFAAINGLFLGPLASSLVEMFPTAKRMTGLTIAYNLLSMIFGGFAPFIASWLIATTGEPISLAYFIMFGAALSGVAILMLRETAHSSLQYMGNAHPSISAVTCAATERDRPSRS